MAFISRKKDSKPAKPAAPAVPAGPSDVFFGTLRSEFDTPEELAEPFVLVHDATAALVDAYRTGRIDTSTTAGALTQMLLTDHNGMEWAVGATTLRWHRRLPGGAWRSAIPPQRVDNAQMVAKAQEISSSVTQLLADATLAPGSVRLEEAVEPATGPDKTAEGLHGSYGE